MGLLQASKTYKPFEYPWAFEYWKRQQQIHWMPEEVPLGEDCRDWAQKLTDHERNLLTQIFRFFTQADVEVQDCYHDKYGRVFKPTEIKMMLTAFSNMETVHIAAYSHLLDTIGMPESEYSAFLQYKEMKDKHDYLATFGVDSDADIARTLAMFGGFTEGLQLFASFAMLMNFPRFNKMKGMGQIVSWSVRDESLHCEGIVRLFHAFVKERDCMTSAVRDDIIDCCQKTVRLEDAFGLSSEFVGLDNFMELFSQQAYLDSFRVTAVFSILVAVVGLGVSLLLAVMADRVIRGAGLYKTLLIWPYAVAPAVVGVLWLFLFSPSVGILAVAVVLESWSFKTALAEARELRGDMRWLEFIRRTKAAELPVVLLEDVGALLGLLFAVAVLALASRWLQSGPATPAPGGCRAAAGAGRDPRRLVWRRRHAA